MKKCIHCGEELPDDVVVCTKCGRYTPRLSVDEPHEPNAPEEPRRPINVLALIGFILSVVTFIIPFLDFFGVPSFVAILLSVGGMIQIKNTDERGTWMAVVGLIVGILQIVPHILMWLGIRIF